MTCEKIEEFIEEFVQLCEGIEVLMIGSTCPHCKKGTLEFCGGYEPYSTSHLACNFCDSTYNINDERV